MGLRTLNPTTPGVRGRIAPDFSELSQGNRPLKALTAYSGTVHLILDVNGYFE